jgi:hypothetical protein
VFEAVQDDPAYKRFNEAKRAEEKLARAIDFMRKYDLKADQSILKGALDWWQGTTNNIDTFGEIKTGQDVFNLLKSFSDSFEAGEIQGAAASVIKGEVKMAQATEAVQEMQKKDGVDFSMGKEQLFDHSCFHLLCYLFHLA